MHMNITIKHTINLYTLNIELIDFFLHLSVIILTFSGKSQRQVVT